MCVCVCECLYVCLSVRVRPTRTWMNILSSASIVSTSLEKRLMIRPSGVVSKKLIGHLSTLLSNASCSLRDAWSAPYATDPASSMMPVTVETTRTLSSWRQHALEHCR